MAIDWDKAYGRKKKEEETKSSIDWDKAYGTSKAERDKLNKERGVDTSGAMYKKSSATSSAKQTGSVESGRRIDTQSANATKRATGKVDMRADEQMASSAKAMQGMTTAERQKYLREYTTQARGTEVADTTLKNKQVASAKEWAQTKADYQAQKSTQPKVSTSEDDKTAEYEDKFYSMSEDEKDLVAVVNAYNVGGAKRASVEDYEKARETLKTEYGYTDDDLTAMTYFYNRYANEKKAKNDEINAQIAMDEHPFLESLATIPMNTAGGIGSMVGNAQSMRSVERVEDIGIKNQTLDPYNEASKMQRDVASARRRFTDTHDWMVGDYDAGDLLYGVAMSGADSFVSSYLPGKYTAGVLRTIRAFSQGTNELSRRGITAEKAMLGGLITGVFEGLFEHLSIGQLNRFKEVPVATVKDIVMNIGKATITNFTEEMATEIANLVYDTAAHEDLSEWNTSIDYLVGTGEYTPEEAKTKVFTDMALQVIEAGVSGALMGAGFGAVGSALGALNNYDSMSELGSNVRNAKLTNSVIAEGQATPDGSKSKGLADTLAKRSEEGKSISDYKLGVLANRNAEVKKGVSEGSFKDVETENLTQVYEEKKLEIENDSSLSKKDKSKKFEQISEEFEKAKSLPEMTRQFQEKVGREISNVERAEATNPEAEINGEKLIANGNNFDSKTKTYGEFKGIFKDKDGDNALSVSNGKTMKVSEYAEHITNKTVARLYQNTVSLSAEAANLFVENWDGESIGEYKRAFDYYYQMGRTGMDIDKIRANDTTYGMLLSAKAQTEIAKVGFKDREFRAGFTNLSTERPNARFNFESKILESVAQKRGLEIFVIDSDSRYNGSYLTGTNRLVIRRNAKGNLLTITAGHESFHFIKNQLTDDNGKAQVKELESFILKALEKNGVDIEAEIQRLMQYDEYSTREDCIEELVADSMFDVFNNQSTVEALLKENRSIFGKIASRLNNFIKDVKATLGLVSTTDSVVKALKDDVESLEKINTTFHDLLSKAGEQYKNETAKKLETLSENGIEFDSSGAAVYSVNYTLDSESMLGKDGKPKYSNESLARMMSEYNGKSYKDNLKFLQDNQSIANLYLNDTLLGYDADDDYSVMKSNSDYPGGDIDFNTNCPKRQEYTAIYDQLQKKFPNHMFTADELAILRRIMVKNGLDVACGLCFVEDRRNKLGENAKEYNGMYQKAIESGNPLTKPARSKKSGDVVMKVTQTVFDEFGDRLGLEKGADFVVTDDYIPTQYDLGTYEGFRNLRKYHPQIAAGYIAYNNSRGQQAGRLIEGRAEYKRQLLNWTKAQVEKANNLGGLRIFSFSDFEAVHALDLIQILEDASSIGLKIQAYTKVNDFAHMVKDTGIKLNRSLIPTATGVKKVDGKLVLAFDTREGIDVNSKDFYDSTDNPNVGNILVGISDEQIRLAMTTDFVDYIIPFHTSQQRRLLEMKNVPKTWKNYRSVQGEKVKSTGKRTKNNVNIYTDVISKHNVTNKVEFVDAFLAECKERGLEPRFSDFLNKNADGDYIYTEGYHKLLIDYKLFDKNGDILPQEIVKPDFETQFIADMLNKYKEGQKAIQGRSAVRDKVINEFSKMMNSGQLMQEIADNKAQYKARKSDIPDIFKGTKFESFVSSQNKIIKTDDIQQKFSTKQKSPIQEHWAEAVRENHHLRNIVSLLDEMQSQNKKIQLDSKDIHKIANEVIKAYSSKYDKTQLADELTVIYDYLANSGNGYDPDTVMETLLEISNNILDQTEVKDVTKYNESKEARDYLRNVKVYIDPSLKAEIESQFGDFKSFRSKMMGKMMHMTTTDASAPTLEWIWHNTLSSLDPEHFPKDINEKDMPFYLEMFFEKTAPQIVDTEEHFQASLEDTAIELASTIFQKYYEVGVLQSVNEKYKNLVFENIKKLERSKKAYRQEYVEKARRITEEGKAYYEGKVREYQETRANTERRRIAKNQLDRNWNYLNRRIEKETDRDHIPEGMKNLVSAFVKAVPETEGYFNKNRLVQFENEYRKLEETSSFFDEDILNRITELNKKLIGDGDVRRMRGITSIELDELRDISEHVKYIVQNENKLFNDRLKGRVDDFANRIHNELENQRDSSVQGVPDMKYRGKLADKTKNFADSIIKGFIKPEYLFSSVGSDTFTSLFKALREGENVEAKIVYEAKQKEQSIKAENNYDARWKNQLVTLNVRGAEYNITVEQAMSLYATSKRGQGLEHMLGGGAVLYTIKDKTKAKQSWDKIRKQIVKEAKSSGDILSVEEINKLTAEKFNSIGKSIGAIKEVRIKFDGAGISALESLLTKDQKNYANAMVEYITKDIGAKRNEVSMKQNGIEKYKESYYYPIRTDRSFIDTNVGKQEVVSTIQQQSAAKRTVEGANNPIVIKGFTETINNHIYESALYCAYVLPMSDIKRVYNFRDKQFVGDGVESLVPRDMSIKDDIKRKNGVNAVKQIEDFLIDVDSGSRYENMLPTSAKLMSKFKKASVMANLSVVVQQPTAVFRAMLYLDPKYFATWANKADIEEMKQWNGNALKKEIGYFDVNMGRTVTDYLDEYETDKSIKKDWDFADRVKNGNIGLKFDQIAGWGASKADEMTWGAIWNACKKQVKAKNSELSGDALNQAASELFQDVIGKTQVYDSVFTKPDYMRRKEGFAMMATAFMSEPLTSLNMLVDATAQARNAKGSSQSETARRFAARAFGVYVTSLVVNNAIKSLVYTIRDDDEEKSILEKYIANVAGGVGDDMVGMIPFVKDIVSVLKGYDPTRMDAEMWSTAVNALSTLTNSDKSAEDKIMALLKAVGQVSGIPAYNVIRDAKAIINIGKQLKDGFENGFVPTTKKGIQYALLENIDSSKFKFIEMPSLAEQAVEAYVEGDTKHYDKQYAAMLKKYGGDQKKADTQLKTALGNAYKDGNADEDQVEDVLKKKFDMDSDKAYWQIQEWDKQKSGDDSGRYDDFYTAVRSGTNVAKVARTYTDHGITKSTLAGRITDEFKEEYVKLYKTNPSQAQTLKTKLLNAYVTLGYDRTKKSKDIDKWVTDSKKKE